MGMEATAQSPITKGSLRACSEENPTHNMGLRLLLLHFNQGVQLSKLTDLFQVFRTKDYTSLGK